MAIGVTSTANVLPLFKPPALCGSKLIPAPVSVVPVMFGEVEFVFHPLGTVFPVGQFPFEDSLKYQRHWYAPEPVGF